MPKIDKIKRVSTCESRILNISLCLHFTKKDVHKVPHVVLLVCSFVLNDRVLDEFLENSDRHKLSLVRPIDDGDKSQNGQGHDSSCGISVPEELVDAVH